MKKLIVFTTLVLFTSMASATTYTIVNVNFTFSPSALSINSGDTVVFQLADIHNVVEVSEQTWLANGNTPLPGFSLDFGGGTLTGLSVGIHYYVCAPHASGGMKGTITVNPSSGIGDPVAASTMFDLSPNPTTGKFFIRLKEANEGQDNGITAADGMEVEIYNLVGNRTLNLQQFPAIPAKEIDLSNAAPGVYFIRIYFREKVYTSKLVVQ